MMVRAITDLSERELVALERGRQKRDLVNWLRNEAASRDGRMAWYVARTNWRADSVADELRSAGIEAVCPKERQWKRYPRSNRRYAVENPLFGNYCFVHLLVAQSAWVGVMSFDGVYCLQGNGERPVALCDAEIENILGMLGGAAQKAVAEAREFDVGDKVLHPLGHFAELHGVVLDLDYQKREATVRTMLFGREMDTTCDIDDLEKLA